MAPLLRGRLRVLCFAPLILLVMLPLFVGSVSRPAAAKNLKRLPNLLLLVTDDQTMYSLARMPYLSSLPEGNWVTFDNAVVATPMCCPSRVTMLTGRYAHRHGVVSNDGSRFDDDESIAVWLDREGYRTGLIGKYLNEYPFGRGRTYIPPGWDDWHAVLDSGDEADYYRYTMNENGSIRTYGSADEDYQTDVLTGKAVDFIQSTTPARPFFLMVNYRAPHRGATQGTAIPAPRHEGDYKGQTYELPPNFNEANVSDKPRWVRRLPLRNDDSQMRAFRREAEAMLAVDESIESMMSTLSSVRELDDTVIVFMTDNGFARGEHRWVTKQCPYQACVSTPLLVRYPGAEEGVENRLVSNVDIAPTLADLGDATPQISQDGRSLVPVLEEKDKTWRKATLLSWRAPERGVPAWWSILTARWQYTTLKTGERELYDMDDDPFQLRNLAGIRDYRSIERRLGRRLVRLRRAP